MDCGVILAKSIANKGIASAEALMWGRALDVFKQQADGGQSWAWERAVDVSKLDVSKFMFLEHTGQYYR